MSPQRNDLAGRVDFLERRLRAVERELRRSRARGGEAPAPRSTAPDRLWAVEVLQGRSGPPFDGPRARGSVVYAGAATTPGAGSVVWQIERPVPPLLEHGWEGAAPVFAALGHPVRLEIVRRLLDGAHTSHELQEVVEGGTTGQLYHHLRELQACGLITSPRRNHYAIRPEKVVPCLVLVAATAELTGREARDVE